MTAMNEHGVETTQIKVGSVVRGIQSDTGEVRTLVVTAREGGRLSVETCDGREPHGSTPLFHVSDVTSIVQEKRGVRA